MDKMKMEMEKYVTDGNEAVEFRLIRSMEDLDKVASNSFKPEMCHQIFGEGETIFGYEDLKIKLYFTAGSLKPYVGIDFKRKISHDGVEADDIVKDLLKAIQPGYFENINNFSAAIAKEINFQPYGTLVHCFKKLNTSYTNNHKSINNNGSTNHVNGESTEKSFEIYLCDTSVPKFTEYLKSMEAFILWFIDAASFVDPDDEKWKFFVMYEKYKNLEGGNSYAFVGYASVYNFYCYPDNKRPRVAQMLLLPPFQKQGLAVELLSAVYSKYRSDPKVVEITVEDPSDEFELLRDYVDAVDCMKLASFSDDNLRKGYSPEMANESKTKFKMTKRQSRRMYEVLRLRITNTENEDEFKRFRLDVKNRLNIPYQKQKADLKRIQRRKLQVDLETTAEIDDTLRKTELESNFQNLYSHYKNVLGRIEKYN